MLDLSMAITSLISSTTHIKLLFLLGLEQISHNRLSLILWQFSRKEISSRKDLIDSDSAIDWLKNSSINATLTLVDSLSYP